VNIAQLAVDASFTAYGVPASYLLAGITPRDVRVIAKTPDVELRFQGTAVLSATALFEVRATSVPIAQTGDRLVVGGIEYEVLVAKCRDPERLGWTLECVPR
jgi:hypothetical protein